MNRSEVIKNFRTVTKAELETMHTKQLMKLLERSRFLIHSVFNYGTIEDAEKAQAFQRMVKEILSTREHIPNKAETKALRKAKIKKGK